MKINVIEPTIDELCAKPGPDAYGYFGVAESLTKIIQEANQHLVVGVNNRWGEGKTTFLKIWEHGLQEKDAAVIYIDAFEYETLEDPFFPICAEIANILPTDKKEVFTEKAKKIAIGTLKFAAGSAIKVITSGVSNGGLLEQSGVESELGSRGAKLVEDGIQKASSYLQNNKEFKVSLNESLNEVFSGTPLIVMIDELDRCRPDYALKFLERIKHLFDIDRIVFVIAVNRDQLYSSINHEYGSALNPHEYAQKFFSFWTVLPRQASTTTDQLDKPREYISYCLNALEYDGSKISTSELIEYFSELAGVFELTLREIQKSLVGFAFVFNAFPKSYREFYELAIVLSVLNVKHTDIIKHFHSEHTYLKLYEESELLSLENDGRLFNNMNRLAFLLWFYTLDSDKARTEYKNYGVHVADRIGDDWIRKIIYTIELNSDLS